MQTSATAQRLEHSSYPASTASIRTARRAVRTAAERAGATGSVLDDIELVASELVSNSVEHGSGDEFTIEVFAGDRNLVLEVTSHHLGDEIQQPEHWNSGPVDSLGGRGLGLIRALSAEAWVGDDADGTVTVGCRFELS